MTKKEAIEQVRKAKLGHKKWISYAKAIHMGIQVDKNAVPMMETECGFGQWYYGDGQIFSELDSFRAIEEPHSLLHNKYMQLFKARKKPLKSGFFVSKKKSMAEKQENVNKLMDQLLQVSEMLMDNLKEFEMELKSMPDSEFLRLV